MLSGQRIVALDHEMIFENFRKVKGGYIEVQMPELNERSFKVLAEHSEPMADSIYFNGSEKIYRWNASNLKLYSYVRLGVLYSTTDTLFVDKLLRHFDKEKRLFLTDKLITKKVIPAKINTLVSRNIRTIKNVATFNYESLAPSLQLIQVYEWLSKVIPDEYSNYMFASMCLARMGEFERSEALMVKATELSGTNRQSISYAWANYYALSGEHDEAMKILLKMGEQGWLAKFPLRNDPDLNKLHDHPDWKKLYRMAK